MESRAKFKSSLGIVLAAAGAAVGLGNVWKFPYILGDNGGGVFLVVYLICVVLIGLPIMLSEFVIGRRSQSSMANAFSNLSGHKRWNWIGIVFLVCSFLFLSFYLVVSGWCLEYLYQSIRGTFSTMEEADIAGHFDSFVSSPWRTSLWTVLSLVLTTFIVYAGVAKGIERFAKILMPLLLVILVVIGILSCTMTGASEGLYYLFHPDFSKLNATMVVQAVGQAFFSLSIGMGIMLTYGSYIDKKQGLLRTATEVCILDTLVAILAAVAIVPAVFAMGMNITEGPELAFIVLPNMFNAMPAGRVIACAFFFLLIIASITSTISVLEAISAYVVEKLHKSRIWAINAASIVLLVSSVAVALSMAGVIPTLGGLSLFEWCDILTSRILMPLGGLLVVVYLGWFLPKKDIQDELSQNKKVHPVLFQLFLFLIRYVVPIGLVIIFVNSWVGL